MMTLLGIALACAALIFGVWAVVRSVEWAARAARPGRHRLREQAAEAEADTFVAELRGLPDRFTPGVYLPRTLQAGDLSPFTPGPVVWTPPAYPPDELDKLKERFLAAAKRGRPMVLPPEATTERMATDTDVRGHAAPDVAQNLCHCGKAAGHLAKDLAGDHPETAFDTTTFQAAT